MGRVREAGAVGPTLAPLQLRDFLLLYNRMTELCFARCVADMDCRPLTHPEVSAGARPRPRPAGPAPSR